MRQLTLEERVRNAAASLEVENVKAEHSYYHGRTDGVSEYGRIWSHSKNCSWAHAFGRMRGFDQVWYGSVGSYDAMAMENWLKIWKLYPEVAGKDPRPLMEASVHTLVTDIIEVAADGQSARGSFITPGVIHSRLTEEGSKYCMILWERYGSDFVYEDGKWVYLHEHVCPDIPGTLDCTNWVAAEYQRLTDPDWKPGPPPNQPPYIADPGPMHSPYSMLNKPADTVPWPEPYETLDNDNTYTPFLD
ncbi:MAG: hypothetical protein LUE21_02785 [Oscillospiraceae bacterium]|nr:hypothetical protein [Oscillospiraceae bacterium]